MPRLRVRPGKATAVVGAIGGLIFIGMGIFIAIPIFGTFGIFWTLFAVVITGYNAFMAFSDQGSERDIYVDNMDGDPQITSRPMASFPQNDDTASRLRKLEALRVQNLISDEEYGEKRAEILQDL